jgi:hypothetical protein
MGIPRPGRQTNNPTGWTATHYAVSNHLNFCMMATSITRIYANRMEKIPARQHIVDGRNHFAFSDVRRSVARAAADNNFGLLLPVPHKSR